MMHSGIEYGNANDSSTTETSSVRMFSPAHGRRTSLHPSTPDHSAEKDEKLPRLHDTSWIGARVSPIPSYDDDEENDQVTARYKRALNESTAAFVSPEANESTSLLRQLRDPSERRNIRLHLHPLWDPNQDSLLLEQKKIARTSPSYRLGKVVVFSTGIFLGLIGLHDAYLWYLSVRKGKELTYPVTWTLPWLAPSSRTLLRFGAYSPQLVVQNGEFWRVVISWFAATSFLDWMTIAWGWYCVRFFSTGMVVLPLYIACCLTGQLWMAAFDTEGVSGTASWGTSGILCAVGVARPDRRFILFLSVIVAVVASAIQPSSSVYGEIGGSFFGWAFNSVGLALSKFQEPRKDDDEKEKELNFFAAAVLVGLWIVPIAYVLHVTADQ
ncbi:unnamed protein product [Cylindrotheca closterium]|uniref:Rhomboid-like protein n=1 Tax=Cylindrotheca closterium TaxID=2856 RepID=A0AAD2GED0_9STRA|nr:unnamed protein product [Cylindrotheca closterium]